MMASWSPAPSPPIAERPSQPEVDPTGGAAPRPAGGAVGVPTPPLAPLVPTGDAAPRAAGGAVEAPTLRRAALAPSIETAFRDALIDSLEALPLGDRNVLRFHYFHGLGADQLAEMLSVHRAAVIRQLARIRERLLRDTRRGLAARLPLDRRALDRVIELARSRFDLAITRVLRSHV